MNGYAKPADAYLNQRILSAGPELQAALIMEAGQMHLGKAIQALAQKDLATATRAFIRVSEVIMEATLRLNTDEGGELVTNLQRLYDHWSREILAASRSRDTIRLAAVAQGMGEIRQAWEQHHESKIATIKTPDFQIRDRVV